MSVASAISGVTPTTANSVDSRTRPLDAAAPRNPPGWMGPAAASPGISGIAPTSAQRAIPSPVHTSVVATAMAMTAAPAVQIATTRVTSLRSSG